MAEQIKHVLGIDIAKETFAARLVQRGESIAPVSEVKMFPNTTGGYQSCATWTQQLGAEPAHTNVVLEATGVYWEACAVDLHHRGYHVSVVNPAQIKHFIRSVLQRGKSDSIDAELIARFGALMKPRLWTPPPPFAEHLQLIIRQRDAYVGMLTQERNRLHALRHRVNCPASVMRMTEDHIQFLEQRVEELERSFKDTIKQLPEWSQLFTLLTSITGIGQITAAVLLTETQAFESFHSARQITAYAGIAPAPYSSGTSVFHAPRISKIGNARLRHALYLAALSASRFNPLMRPVYQRLVAKGKPSKVARVAIARKLLITAFAVVKSKCRFDPSYSHNNLVPAFAT